MPVSTHRSRRGAATLGSEVPARGSDVEVRGGERHGVRQLVLRPGDLQLFQGRYALHRVSQVRGATARHTAIFAYSERPGVVGNLARTRQLFGRVRPEHVVAAGRVRGDQLLD